VVVADASSCLVGGRNIGNRYNDMPGVPAWLDWAVYAEGEVAAGLYNVCAKQWNNHCEAGEQQTLITTAPYVPADECQIRIRINDWVNRKTEVLQSYMQMFGTASSEIIIMTSYFWPGRKLVRKMAKAAARGVKVKMVLAAVSDIALAKYAERYMYRWLFRKNIEIYEYDKQVLHGKIAVCDNKWVTIGSYNVNNISAYASVELNLDIMNPAFATNTRDQLNAIIENDCELVTKDKYAQRYGFYSRIFQRAAFVLLNIIFFIFTFYFRRAKKTKKL
jgi:cardiolipin synthase